MARTVARIAVSAAVLATVATAAPAAAEAPTTFYVSSSQGDDANDGRSPGSAWRTLSKASNAPLGPGDQLVFRRGDRFAGQLVVTRSGQPGSPVTFGAYGTGDRPVLDGAAASGGAADAAIVVRNQEHLEFRSLDITNDRRVSRPGVPDVTAFGLLVRNTSGAELTGYRLHDLVVHDVSSVTISRDDFEENKQAGIHFEGTLSTSRISDVSITNSRFERGARFGARVVRNGADVVFRGNTCVDTGGTCFQASQVTNLLIEDNFIHSSGAKVRPERQVGRGSGAWFFGCQYVVAQRNVVHGARGWGDSAGIHADMNNEHVLMQYNRFYDNIGYGLEILGGNNDLIARYNYFLDDGYRENNGGIFHLSVFKVGVSTNLSIYQNTFVVGPDRGDSPFWVAAKDSAIYNNIFMAAAGSSIGPLKTFPDTGNLVFTHNLFHNAKPAVSGMDRAPVLAAPRFTGGEPYWASSHRLQENSAALAAGIVRTQPRFAGAGDGIFADVPPTATRDFFGNPVPATPNIGAYQGPGL